MRRRRGERVALLPHPLQANRAGRHVVVAGDRLDCGRGQQRAVLVTAQGRVGLHNDVLGGVVSCPCGGTEGGHGGSQGARTLPADPARPGVPARATPRRGANHDGDDTAHVSRRGGLRGAPPGAVRARGLDLQQGRAEAGGRETENVAEEDALECE